ncbi:septum site-determining protein minD [Striga asiatica]|uniref:Septum site-determining protein minD n=1 Tax=Striga asiatica TaxID=4170 RepID=A0A5A7Q8E9_STRAF|nr:septum site-determining protein minD [Striga asiatica]
MRYVFCGYIDFDSIKSSLLNPPVNTTAKPSLPHLIPKNLLRRSTKTLAAAPSEPSSTIVSCSSPTRPPRVEFITSGKGGKTSTTAQIGLSLARLGFFVVAIDADIGHRNLDLLLSLENRVK